MKEFGTAFLSGSRFIFWSVMPVAVAAGIVLLLDFSEYTTRQKLLVIGIELVLVLVVLSLASPKRWRAATRVLAACVPVLYIAYFLDEMLTEPGGFTSPGRRSESSAGNAMKGLIFFGVPCAIYAIRGSLLPRPAASPLETETLAGSQETDDTAETTR